MVRRRCKQCGVRFRKPHMLRSSYSCEFLTQGGPERAWQCKLILGHADMQMIEKVYAKSVQEKLSLEAHAGTFPRGSALGSLEEEMLYFANKPDPAFAEMVDDTLELAADILSDADDDMIGTYPERIQGLSTAQTFLSEVEKLLDSHRSPGVFRLTDYHWLILHKLLNETVCEHNDGEFLFEELKIKEIDFDALLDIYFWDLDFLIPQGVFDAIPMEGKSQSGVSPETFGVIGGLKPHPSELELSAVEVCPEEWQVPDIYRPGEDYPFWPMRGEGE